MSTDYDTAGRKSIPPGVYVHMLLVGYFEGVNSMLLKVNVGDFKQELLSELQNEGFLSDVAEPDDHGKPNSKSPHTSVRKFNRIRNRYTLHAAAKNLSTLLRKLIGVGTPRELTDHWKRVQDQLQAWREAFGTLWATQIATCRASEVHSRARSLKIALVSRW